MSSPWLRLLDNDFPATAQPGDIQHARALNNRCRHEEAVAILDPLLAEDRQNGEAWFERIVAMGDGRDAENLETLHQELEALRDEQPKNAMPYRNLGYVRLLQLRLDDAERALRQSLERDGHDPKTLELMGLLALQRDQPAEAKAFLLKALTIQPKDPRTLRILGLACEGLEDFKSAGIQLTAALDVDNNYFWGWHSLGEMLLKRGDMKHGLRCIHRARSIQPAEPASYFMISEIFSEQGHLDMAQAEIHHLMLMATSSSVLAEAYALLGEYKRDLGDRDGAVSYFSLSLETDPDAANPWAALGDMAREDARWEDALRCYREALAREPEAADLHIQIGYVMLKNSHYEDAEQCFLTALEFDPAEYSAYLGLSEVARMMNRREDQARMVKEAMTLAPEDPDVWNAHGVVLEVSGRLEEATQAYEKVLKLSPMHRKAANNLGFVLEKRVEAGEKHLKQAAVNAWKQRLFICRDEGQSLKMAIEHLLKLGIKDSEIQQWLEREFSTAESR